MRSHIAVQVCASVLWFNTNRGVVYSFFFCIQHRRRRFGVSLLPPTLCRWPKMLAFDTFSSSFSLWQLETRGNITKTPLARYCRGPRQLPERFNFILLRVTPQVSEMRSWGFLCYSSSFLRHWRFSSFACSIPITHVKHKGLCAKIRLSFLSFKWLLETFWP